MWGAEGNCPLERGTKNFRGARTTSDGDLKSSAFFGEGHIQNTTQNAPSTPF